MPLIQHIKNFHIMRMGLSHNDIFFSEMFFWGIRMISFQEYRLGEAQKADSFSGCQVSDIVQVGQELFI